jgi:hypothetical protein
VRFSGCALIVTLDARGPASSRGSTAESFIYGRGLKFPGGKRVPIAVGVVVANAADQNVPDSFYLAVVC